MSLERRKSTAEFIKEAKDKWGDKYDYSITEYINRKTKIKFLFNSEIYEQLPSNHLRYAVEKISKPITQDFFIEKAINLNGDKYDYSKTIIISSTKKVIIICNKHGDFLQTPHSHLQGKGCPICKESKGNKLIKNILDKYNVDYLQEYKFDECKNKQKLPFDFYIKSLNTCIEFDGEQHYKPIEKFGGITKLIRTKNNDNIKNKFCNENNINLIRISYKEINKIESIINSLIKKSH